MSLLKQRFFKSIIVDTCSIRGQNIDLVDFKTIPGFLFYDR
jgi:hypothetical protein